MKKLDEKFEIMTDADLSVTEGGIVVTTSTAVAWGVLGVVTYMYGRHLGSRRECKNLWQIVKGNQL